MERTLWRNDSKSQNSLELVDQKFRSKLIYVEFKMEYLLSKWG